MAKLNPKAVLKPAVSLFLICLIVTALLAVNKLRTVVRQTELAAYAAFRDADGNVTRGDMILGLNRLSSLMWIFMIKLKAGRYERK